jgi:putative endonuclease
MKFSNKVTGRLGEGLAARYLQGKKYQIIQRNFSTRFGEIDLICRDGGTLVFVEVKTKKGVGFGLPEEMVGSRKINQVKRMATVYLGGREVACRIDVVAVVLDSENSLLEVRHYENVIG